MAKAKKTATTETSTAIRAIKGFDGGLKCRGFQFSAGETYTHAGPVKVCREGFHAISGYPLEVFSYYPPAGSRFAIVELSGRTDADVGSDSKIAAEIIKIGSEIGFSELTAAAVRWVMGRVDMESAATNTGGRSAATNTGDRSAATCLGNYSVAMASGFHGRASGSAGCALFLVRRRENWGEDNHGEITHAWAGIVGRDGIEPNTVYTLDEAGQAVKVED